MKDRLKKILLNSLVIFVIIIVIAFMVGQKWKANNNNYKIITNKKEFQELYFNYDPSILLIDLRDERDYEKGHLDMFINIPFENEGDGKLLEFLAENKYWNKTLVLMCYTSKRSAKAFNSLTEHGYNNIIFVNMDSNELLDDSDNIVTGPCNCLD